MRRPDSSVLLLLGGIAAVFLAQRYFYPATLIVHGIVDLFAIGRSLTKVNLFLAYAALLCVLALWPRLRVALGALRVHMRWVLISISAAFLYGLSLSLLFFSRWGFWFGDAVITFNNSELSSTMLLHNHVTKGIGASLANLLGAARQENLDTGGAFLGLLPDPLYWIGALLVATCAVLLLTKFLGLYGAQKERRAAFVMLYAMVSFVILKNLLDGGVLDQETLIGVAGLLLILIRNDRVAHGAGARISYWWASAPLAAYLAAIAVLSHFRLISIPFLHAAIFPATAFVLILATLFYWTMPGAKRRLPLVLLTASTAFLISLSVSAAVGTYLNARQTIGPAGAVVALYRPPAYGSGSPQDWQEADRINDLHIYLFRPARPTRISEIILNNSLVNSYFPIQTVGGTCDPKSDSSQIDFTLTTTEPLRDDRPRHAHGRIAHAVLISSRDSEYRYDVTASIAPCTPRLLNVLQELIMERAVQPFFMSGISAVYDPLDDDR